MSPKRRITIKEIAQEAGVSMQTVSRVINDRPDVSVATRKRIKEIIAQHNYHPSNVARGITQGRSHILGVVSANLQYHGPAGMLMGVEKYASQLGYTIILRVVRDLDRFDIDETLNFFMSQHVDGMIWTLPEIGDLREIVVQKVPQLHLPTVCLNMQPHPDLTVVDFDNRLGTRLAVEHLLEQADGPVGLITGPLTWLSARERYLGWRNAIEAAGFEAEANLVAHGDWSATSGEQALTQLLGQRPELDAVFVSNDLMSLGAMKAARSLRRRIPEDLLMAGYDNVPEAAFFCPPLTTVTNDFEGITQFTIEMLDRAIVAEQREEESGDDRQHIFTPSLIVRDSSVRQS